MKTTIKEENGTCVMSFIGRLDTSSSPQVEKEMQPLYDLTDRRIILDCSQLEYISSSGLRLFLRLVKNAKIKGCTVSLMGLSANIRQIFDETGLTRLFQN